MKLWFCFGLASFIVLSCGRRNASDVYEFGEYQSQKPIQEESWTWVTDGAVLDDHRIKFVVDVYQYESPIVSYQVFVDEKTQAVHAYIYSREEKFGEMKCLQTVAGLCRDYEISSVLDVKYRIRRQDSLKITTKSAGGEKQSTYPWALIQQEDSMGTRSFVVTSLPTDPVIHFLDETLYFPGFSFSVMPLSFGLTGSLKEPFSFYRFTHITNIVGSSENILHGYFEHILTGQREVIEWQMRK